MVNDPSSASSRFFIPTHFRARLKCCSHVGPEAMVGACSSYPEERVA